MYSVPSKPVQYCGLCTVSPLNLVLYCVLCTLYSVPSKQGPYCVLCTVYPLNMFCTVYCVQCTLCPERFGWQQSYSNHQEKVDTNGQFCCRTFFSLVYIKLIIHLKIMLFGNTHKIVKLRGGLKKHTLRTC